MRLRRSLRLTGLGAIALLCVALCATWVSSYRWSIFFQIRPFTIADRVHPSLTIRASKGTFLISYYHYAFAPEDAARWRPFLAAYPPYSLRTSRVHYPIEFQMDDRDTVIWQWHGYGFGRERETMSGNGSSPGSPPASATGYRLTLILPVPLLVLIFGLPVAILLWRRHRCRHLVGFPVGPTSEPSSCGVEAMDSDTVDHPSDSERPK